MQTPFIAGLMSGLVLIIAIGAQNSFVLRQAIRREHRLPIALICILSDALLIALGIAGLGALIQASTTWMTVTRYGGATFLLGYAVQATHRAWQGEQLNVETNGTMSLAAALVTCIGFTFLNPHVYLDTVVLLGALANQQGASGRWYFGAGAASASLVWFTALAYGANVLAPLFRKPSAWRVLDSFIALVMFVLAVSLLIG